MAEFLVTMLIALVAKIIVGLSESYQQGYPDYHG